MDQNHEPVGNPEAIAGSSRVRVSTSQRGIRIRSEGRPVSGNIPTQHIVYLVLDCSTSMSGKKIQKAKEGAFTFAVDARTKGYFVGLIQFGSLATHICEPQKDPQDLLRHLHKLEAAGSTNMAAGIRLATSHLENTGWQRAMLVVTDGSPDSEEDALGVATLAKQKGIQIITLGTEDADRNFLRQLSSRSDLAAIVSSKDLAEGIRTTAKMLPTKIP